MLFGILCRNLCLLQGVSGRSWCLVMCRSDRKGCGWAYESVARLPAPGQLAAEHRESRPGLFSEELCSLTLLCCGHTLRNRLIYRALPDKFLLRIGITMALRHLRVTAQPESSAAHRDLPGYPTSPSTCPSFFSAAFFSTFVR